ncbi:BtaA family protein [Neolewinella lacunae]|uniref:BtaA family protein n=1 Tax=Neolewinella lacunae TaxID=1517758 RepID=A0A923PJF8_9BACT|nr:BtaA family protein [Neolewinella lacunae]MBC6994439.1 BtaA family protein [Neolewinella lacunae]MDN3633375.1 BtaA family protein [Neolewinella lacunae]
MTIATHAKVSDQTFPPTAYPPRGRTEVLKDWLFERIHGNKLVYNTCWEDPRCDRAMLDINAESEVVMITSAGDNALDYLLDGPRAIHCVDVNPRQNALLELKLAGLESLEHEDFFGLFGRGCHPQFSSIYTQHLRPRLSENSREYWDGQARYFKPSGVRQGLYFHGSSGLFAWCASRLLALDGTLRRGLDDLLQAPDLETQRNKYYALEDKLLDRLVGGPWRQKISLSLVGVPASQRYFIEQEAGGLRHYVKNAFRHIFTELPIHENYFYHLYLKGQYSARCHPAYLAEKHFAVLAERCRDIHPHTTTVAEFLVRNPAKYSQFVLLDHQDWLAANAPAALAQEWQLILTNSRPGTRILLRSAASRPETVPDFVRQRVRFRHDLSAPQARLDRVGTYAGTFLLEVVE